MSKNIQVRLYIKFIIKVFVFRVFSVITQVNNDIGRGSSVVRVSSRYGMHTVIVFSRAIANGEIAGCPDPLAHLSRPPWTLYDSSQTCKRKPHATYASYLPYMYSKPAV